VGHYYGCVKFELNDINGISLYTKNNSKWRRSIIKKTKIIENIPYITCSKQKNKNKIRYIIESSSF